MQSDLQVKDGYYYQLYRQVSLGGKVESPTGGEEARQYVARQYLTQTKDETSVSLFLDTGTELVNLNAQFDPTGTWLPALMFAGSPPEGMEYSVWEQYCRHALYLFHNISGVADAFQALPYMRHYFDPVDREVDEAEAVSV